MRAVALLGVIPLSIPQSRERVSGVHVPESAPLGRQRVRSAKMSTAPTSAQRRAYRINGGELAKRQAVGARVRGSDGRALPIPCGEFALRERGTASEISAWKAGARSRGGDCMARHDRLDRARLPLMRELADGTTVRIRPRTARSRRRDRQARGADGGPARAEPSPHGDRVPSAARRSSGAL